MKIEVTQFETAKATNDEVILANLLSELLIHARKEKVSVKDILKGNIAFPEKRVINVARRSGQSINSEFIAKLETLANKISAVFGVETSKK
jgi:hypothetical protein